MDWLVSDENPEVDDYAPSEEDILVLDFGADSSIDFEKVFGKDVHQSLEEAEKDAEGY